MKIQIQTLEVVRVPIKRYGSVNRAKSPIYKMNYMGFGF